MKKIVPHGAQSAAASKPNLLFEIIHKRGIQISEFSHKKGRVRKIGGVQKKRGITNAN